MFEEKKSELRKRLFAYKKAYKKTYYALYLDIKISAHAIRCFLLDEANTSIRTLDMIEKFLIKKGF